MEIPLTRTFPCDPDTAFAWLTDYREDDGKLTTAILEGRDVVERSGDTVHMVTRIRRPLGRTRTRVQDVTLFPGERRWESRITQGYGAGSYHRYRLTPAPEGTRLDIVFGFAAATPLRAALLRLGRPLLRARLEKMWDGFSEALRRDLAASSRAEALVRKP